MPKIVEVEGTFRSKFIVEDDESSDERIIEIFEERIFYWTLEEPEGRNPYDTVSADIVIKEKKEEDVPW